MKSLAKFIFYILVLLTTVSIAMGASFILPYPWSKVNILFAVLLIILAFRPQGTVVWMAFLAHFFLELYTTTPFGVLLLSGTMSTLLTYWAYQSIFSNRSWYAMVAMSIFTLIIYRCLYATALWVAHLVHPDVIQISWGSITETAAWEILFTTLLVAVIYLIFFYHKNKPVMTRLYGKY